MLEFFRSVAQTIPSGSPSPSSETPVPSADPSANTARDMLQDRAGIIVLREDLDFYAIPPKADIDQTEMIEVKRAAGRALLKQDGIFSGLRRSEESGTTEQHLIEMLTAGYVFSSPLPPNPLSAWFQTPQTNPSFSPTAASIMTIAGVIAPANPKKPSSAVLPSPVSGQTSRVVRVSLIATRWAWRRNCSSFGGNRREDVGGKE